MYLGFKHIYINKLPTIRKMKNIALILVFLLLISCTDKKGLEGFWYGQHEKNESFSDEVNPILLKFEKNNYIDYLSHYDTLNYKYFHNRIYVSTRKNPKQKFNFKIKLKDSILKLYSSETGELFAILKKKNKLSFLSDFIKDKTFDFDLPVGKGEIKTIGYDFNFSEPLYLTYQNNKLTSYFRGKTQIVDNKYFEFILHNTFKDYEHTHKPAISLIADKEIKISDLNLLKKHIKIADYESIIYVMKSDDYDKSKSYNLRIQRLSDKEKESFKDKKEKLTNHLDSIKVELHNKLKGFVIGAIDPEIELQYPKFEFDANHSILLKIDKSNFTINKRRIEKSELKNLISERIKKDSNFYISLYITDKSTYQNYIDFLDVSYKEVLELRNNYLKEKYDLKKNSRNYSNEYKDKIKESKRKYPFSFWEINEVKYDSIKKNLLNIE